MSEHPNDCTCDECVELRIKDALEHSGMCPGCGWPKSKDSKWCPACLASIQPEYGKEE